MSSYHNTNKEEGATLFSSEVKAVSQEDKILKIFQDNPNLRFSPEEIQEILGEGNTPITSIRRAISNLSNSEKWAAIHKTDKMKKGNYGKMVHTWKLNQKTH